VTAVKTAQNANDNTSMSVKLLSVTFGGRTYPVDATVTTAATERVRSATTGDDAKKVVGGAVIGAIAGQVIGKSTKGTVVGAAAGAAAGTAAAAATGNYDTCLNSGASIAVRLDESATIRVSTE
jgi:outer membrane lipoprotein SlyB